MFQNQWLQMSSQMCKSWIYFLFFDQTAENDTIAVRRLLEPNKTLAWITISDGRPNHSGILGLNAEPSQVHLGLKGHTWLGEWGAD